MGSPCVWRSSNTSPRQWHHIDHCSSRRRTAKSRYDLRRRKRNHRQRNLPGGPVHHALTRAEVRGRRQARQFCSCPLRRHAAHAQTTINHASSGRLDRSALQGRRGRSPFAGEKNSWRDGRIAGPYWPTIQTITRPAELPSDWRWRRHPSNGFSCRLVTSGPGALETTGHSGFGVAISLCAAGICSIDALGRRRNQQRHA